MSNVDVKIRRAKSYPSCGRLIVMGAFTKSRPLDVKLLEDNFSIDFPSMPESLELARQTDYKVVSNMVVPDGVHQYRYTSPLEIPFSFELHSRDDEYCPDGSLTLLRVAARLHALTLPFGDSESRTVEVGNDAPLVYSRTDPNAKSPGNDANQQAKLQQPDDLAFFALDGAKFDPPVTCRLELMFTRESEPGIVCNGYVKSARVSLKGPWMRGPGNAFNLPTWGEFNFVFVHRPAHYNSFSQKNAIVGGYQSQAYADYVLKNFYATYNLSGAGNYRGFSKS